MEYRGNDPVQNVVVTDIKMPFLSMVLFMVKWAIASIPAILILLLIAFLVAFPVGLIAHKLQTWDSGQSGKISKSNDDSLASICESKGLVLIYNDKGEPKCENPEEAMKASQSRHDQIMRDSK